MTEPLIGMRNLRKELDNFEKGLGKQMVAEAKGVLKPAQTRIKAEIAKPAPLSGMNSNGRLSWNNPQNKRVTISYSSTRSTKKSITPLLSIKILGAAAQMVDSAGKARRSIPPRTSPYPYNGGIRSHKVNRQGVIMTKELRARKWVSFVYKSVMDIKPQLEGEARLVVEKYAKMVNKRI